MPFFPELPPQPPRGEARPRETPVWLEPPRDQIPVAVPIARELGRSTWAVLHLLRVDAYRDGVAFAMQFDALRSGEDDDAAERLMRGGSPIRVGVTLADGSTCIADVGGQWAFSLGGDEPEPPQLTMRGGGGSGDSVRITQSHVAWLWPMPPAGPLTIHVEALRAGIAETATTVELDLEGVAGRVLDVWPE